jgi:hypothetical protein
MLARFESMDRYHEFRGRRVAVDVYSVFLG